MLGGADKLEIRWVLGNKLLKIDQSKGSGAVWHHKWIGLINDVMECVDMKNNSFLFLPSGGGFYDQDPDIIDIWIAIKQEYIKYMSDEVFVERIRKAWNG